MAALSTRLLFTFALVEPVMEPCSLSILPTPNNDHDHGHHNDADDYDNREKQLH